MTSFTRATRYSHGAMRPDSVYEWTPGQLLIVPNWPTLSKNPENPDAGLWHPRNPSG